MFQTCLRHAGFVPVGVMLQRLPKNGILDFRLAAVWVVLLEATVCVAVAHFPACSQTCYPEASRSGVPLDCLVFMSCRNQLQSACRDYRTWLCLKRVCYFGSVFVSDALHM